MSVMIMFQSTKNLNLRISIHPFSLKYRQNNSRQHFESSGIKTKFF